jgi:hypothetical protein
MTVDTVSTRDLVIYALAGLGVWLNGAITFHLGGKLLFQHGPALTAVVALVIAVLVCAAFRFAMTWRKAQASQAVTVAVAMALPGLFGEAARQLVFPWATGLRPEDASTFAAVIFFGNGVLLAYAVLVARRPARAVV